MPRRQLLISLLACLLACQSSRTLAQDGGNHGAETTLGPIVHHPAVAALAFAKLRASNHSEGHPSGQHAETGGHQASDRPAVAPLSSSALPAIGSPDVATATHIGLEPAPVASAAAATAAAAATTTTIMPIVAHPTGDPAKPQDKLSKYFIPICENIDKITARQLFKIQRQMKSFVEKTAGKMSLCFAQHFEIDPNLSPVERSHLSHICASRHLPVHDRTSFVAFELCASQNWDLQLEKELDRILLARANCANNHQHPKANGSDVAHLTHDSEDDEDELALIGDVVSKVLEGNATGLGGDIKLIDVSASSPNSSAPPTTSAPRSPKLLNDPNTMVVFVEETNKRASKGLSDGPQTTAIPSLGYHLETTVKSVVIVEHSVGSTAEPVPMRPEVPHVNVTKLSAGDLADKINAAVANITSAVPHIAELVSSAPSTAAPIPPAIEITPTGYSTSKPATTIPVVASKSITTAALPGVVSSTAKPGDIVAKTTNTTTTTTTQRPLEKLEEMLRRQEKEKSELEAKLKAEREKIMKQLQRKQDEIDARNAIKALQVQRTASGHGSQSDARMHLIEHERQMAIDPVGHTIKHQQHELNKQQRAAAAAASGKR